MTVHSTQCRVYGDSEDLRITRKGKRYTVSIVGEKTTYSGKAARVEEDDIIFDVTEVNKAFFERVVELGLGQFNNQPKEISTNSKEENTMSNQVNTAAPAANTNTANQEAVLNAVTKVMGGVNPEELVALATNTQGQENVPAPKINTYGNKFVPVCNTATEVAGFLLTVPAMLALNDTEFATATNTDINNKMEIALKRQGLNIAYQQYKNPGVEGVGQPGHHNYQMLPGTITEVGGKISAEEVAAEAPKAQAEAKSAVAAARKEMATEVVSEPEEDWTDTALRWGGYAVKAAAVAGALYLVYRGYKFLTADDE